MVQRLKIPIIIAAILLASLSRVDITLAEEAPTDNTVSTKEASANSEAIQSLQESINRLEMRFFNLDERLSNDIYQRAERFTGIINIWVVAASLLVTLMTIVVGVLTWKTTQDKIEIGKRATEIDDYLKYIRGRKKEIDGLSKKARKGLEDIFNLRKEFKEIEKELSGLKKTRKKAKGLEEKLDELREQQEKLERKAIGSYIALGDIGTEASGISGPSVGPVGYPGTDPTVTKAYPSQPCVRCSRRTHNYDVVKGYICPTCKVAEEGWGAKPQ